MHIASSNVRVRESLKKLSTCSFVKLAMSMNLSGPNKRQAQNYRTKVRSRSYIAMYQWYGLIISIPEAAHMNHNATASAGYIRVV